MGRQAVALRSSRPLVIGHLMISPGCWQVASNPPHGYQERWQVGKKTAARWVDDFVKCGVVEKRNLGRCTELALAS